MSLTKIARDAHLYNFLRHLLFSFWGSYPGPSGRNTFPKREAPRPKGQWGRASFFPVACLVFRLISFLFMRENVFLALLVAAVFWILFMSFIGVEAALR